MAFKVGAEPKRSHHKQVPVVPQKLNIFTFFKAPPSAEAGSCRAACWNATQKAWSSARRSTREPSIRHSWHCSTG